MPITWVGQWLVLRRHIPRASRWLLASSLWALLGLTVGAIEGTRLQDAIDGVESSPLGIASIGPGRSYLGYYLGTAVAGAGIGAALGYGQWMILRWSFRRAGWWVLASTVGFSGGIVLNQSILVGGLVAGSAFLWPLKKRSAQPVSCEPVQPKARVSTINGMLRAAKFDKAFPQVLRDPDYATTDRAVLVVVISAILIDIARFVAGDVSASLIRELIAGVIGSIQCFFVQVVTTYFFGVVLFRGKASFGSFIRALGFARSPAFLVVFAPFVSQLFWLAAITWVVAASAVAIGGLLHIGSGKATIAVCGGVFAWLLYGMTVLG